MVLGYAVAQPESQPNAFSTEQYILESSRKAVAHLSEMPVVRQKYNDRSKAVGTGGVSSSFRSLTTYIVGGNVGSIMSVLWLSPNPDLPHPTEQKPISTTFVTYFKTAA